MAVVVESNLSEFSNYLDYILRHMLGFVGGPLWIQELNLIIPVGFFLLRTVSDLLL